MECLTKSMRLNAAAFIAFLLTTPPAAASAAERNYQPAERTANETKWQSVSLTAINGKQVLVTNSYIQVEPGLNFQDENGVFREASDTIEVVTGKGVARNAGHKAIFSGNVNDATGTLTLELPDKRIVREQPIGIAFTDLTTGKSAFMAEVQHAAGVVDNNDVLYQNALEGGIAIRYRFRKGSIERDVILSTQLPDPRQEPFSMNPENVMVEIWTEFLEGPQPEIVVQKRSMGINGRGLPHEEHRLSFGSMRFGAGQGFQANAQAKAMNGRVPPSDSIPISLEWKKLQGMSFLIESIPFKQLAPKLQNLPKAHVAFHRLQPRTNDLAANRFERQRPMRLARSNPNDLQPGKTSQIAQASKGTALDTGFVLDYVLLTGASDYVFRGDTTYYITNSVYCYGTTVIEGGSVMKFTAGSGLNIGGTVSCLTSQFHPAFLTAKDDDTVGEIISGSSGAPSGNYGDFRFWSNTKNQTLHDLRFRHLTTGILSFYSGAIEARNLQFMKCQNAVSLYASTIHLGNTLLDHCNTSFFANGGTANVQHGTFATCASMYASDGNDGAFNLVNCILAGSPASGSYGTNTTISCASYDSTNGVFQIAGAGLFYLPAISPERDAGTTSIWADLAQELKVRTTAPPIIVSSDWAAGGILSPWIPMDINIPDIGYHYDPADYYISNRVLSGGSLLLTNGVRILVAGSAGITITNGSSFVSEGTPNAPSRIVSYQCVQEQPLAMNSSFSLINVAAASASSEVRLRWTDLTMMANTSAKRRFFENGSFAINALRVQDCQLHNVSCSIQQSDATAMAIAWTNNLFERCSLLVNRASTNGVAVYSRNNLFKGGELNLSYTTEGSNPGWELRDNLFDSVALSGGGAYATNSHNAYYATTNLTNSAGNNVSLSVVDYKTGPFGRYYYPTTGTNLAALIDAGSRSADTAGLYQRTSVISQSKEGTSTVDIGYHYPTAINPLQASQGFSAAQGTNNWYYRYASTGQGYPTGDLPSYDSGNTQWGGVADSSTVIAQGSQHPGATNDSVRTLKIVFPGEILITGTATCVSTNSDGVKIRVLRNNDTVVNWITLSGGGSTNLSGRTLVNVGDQIHFQVNRNSGNGSDTVSWDPTISYSFKASNGFTYSGVQGSNGWWYYYSTVVAEQPDALMETCCWGQSDAQAGPSTQTPGTDYDSIRSFLCPFSGTISIASVIESIDDSADGIYFRILKNTGTLWSFQYLAARGSATVNTSLTVSAGDLLHFQVHRYIDNVGDTVSWDPVITYDPFVYTWADYNGNGIIDCVEDRNGDGLVSSWETDWKSPSDTGLRVWITEPRVGQIIP